MLCFSLGGSAHAGSAWRAEVARGVHEMVELGDGAAATAAAGTRAARPPAAAPGPRTLRPKSVRGRGTLIGHDGSRVGGAQRRSTPGACTCLFSSTGIAPAPTRSHPPKAGGLRPGVSPRITRQSPVTPAGGGRHNRAARLDVLAAAPAPAQVRRGRPWPRFLQRLGRDALMAPHGTTALDEADLEGRFL